MLTVAVPKRNKLPNIIVLTPKDGYDPQGIYYGGTIAAPVIGDIFENIFPYLGIEKE